MAGVRPRRLWAKASAHGRMEQKPQISRPLRDFSSVTLYYYCEKYFHYFRTFLIGKIPSKNVRNRADVIRAQGLPRAMTVSRIATYACIIPQAGLASFVIKFKCGDDALAWEMAQRLCAEADVGDGKTFELWCARRQLERILPDRQRSGAHADA